MVVDIDVSLASSLDARVNDTLAILFQKTLPKVRAAVWRPIASSLPTEPLGSTNVCPQAGEMPTKRRTSTWASEEEYCFG
jgi:hypothetical protein